MRNMLGSTVGAWNAQTSPSDPKGLENTSFSAVLQDIFQQTQNEIRASRSRHRMPPLVRSRSVGYQYDIPDETQRFEPLLDPALSYISSILAEEDEYETDEPCLSPNDYMAYHAKQQEVAALLKEDSPSLGLGVQSENAVSSDAGSVTLSEESISQSQQDTAGSDIFSCVDFQWPSFSDTFSVLSANETYAIDSSPDIFSSMNSNLPSFPSPAAASESSAIESLGRKTIEQPKVQAHEDSRTDSIENTHWARQEKRGLPDEPGLNSNAQGARRTNRTEKVLKARKESKGPSKRTGGRHRSSRDGEQDLVDLNDLLLQSAQAVGGNNMKRAVEILTKVKQYASPHGNGAQRIAYYFAEALDARFSGTGWPLYRGVLRSRPSPAVILRATYVYMASCPFVKASHYFINQTILNAAKGASKLHILELQITGFQYPSLLKALAARPGGPPLVRITGFGFPHYAMMPARTEMILEGVQKAGRQLAEYAASCGVPFEYTAWAGMREDLQMQDFVNQERGEDEVLIVISAYLLRYIMDETVDSPTARLRLLRQGQSINPNVYIQGIVTGAYNTPFFYRRFREALFHFDSLFDMLDTFIEKENTDRVVYESEILGKAILNIVACEGTEVVERVDKYKHWQAISEEVGFRQLPLNEDIKNNVQAMLNTWHKEYTVAESSQYLLMGWKGRLLHGLSTWKASD